MNGECVDDYLAPGQAGNAGLFPYPSLFRPNQLTPAKCIAKCQSPPNPQSFAGIQNGNECYCGSVAPPQERIVDIGECDIDCNEDTSIKCGGSNRKMSVYTT